MNEYEKQATDFLTSTNTEFKAEFLKYGFHFGSDKEKRDVYTITLKRGSREFTFDFGQSINNSMQWIPESIYAGNLWRQQNQPRLVGGNKNTVLKKAGIYSYSLNSNGFVENKNFSAPTAYDVLSCLTSYEVGGFEDFCGEYGYDEDSRNAEKVYKAVLNEWKNVAMLWNDEEIEKLQEIN
jgi:hypothetical protein